MPLFVVPILPMRQSWDNASAKLRMAVSQGVLLAVKVAPKDSHKATCGPRICHMQIILMHVPLPQVWGHVQELCVRLLVPAVDLALAS